jgi:hypothetical protein
MEQDKPGGRWIDGSRIDRKLSAEEARTFFDRSVSAWRFTRIFQGRDGKKTVWQGPFAVNVAEARDALVATKGQPFLLSNAAMSFHGSTRHGDEWYFLSKEFLDLSDLAEMVVSPELAD